jgi:hypothetical protein
MRSFLIPGLMVAAGCATFPPPHEALASSMASVRGAEEVGAEGVPAAALALSLARDEVDRAKALMSKGENERAYYMALRAVNDAELANALAREEHAASEKQRAEADAKAAAKPTP